MIFVKLPASCRDRIRHCDNPADRTNNSLSLLFTSFKAASESLHDNLSWKLFQYRNTVKSKQQYNSSPAYCLSFTLHTLRPLQLGNITNIFPCRIRQCKEMSVIHKAAVTQGLLTVCPYPYLQCATKKREETILIMGFQAACLSGQRALSTNTFISNQAYFCM